MISKLVHDKAAVNNVKIGMDRAWGEMNDGATHQTSKTVAEQLKQKHKDTRKLEQEIHKMQGELDA